MACESCVDDHGAPGCGLLEGGDSAAIAWADVDDVPCWTANVEQRRADGSLSAAWVQAIWLDELQKALYCAGDIKPGDTFTVTVVA
jgi:hypothetical protein